jgi:NADPH-dependent curcumin reductase CurA
MNRRIVLASRPTAAPGPENFRLETVPVPQPGPGEVLIRNHWLSLDPYMRGRMSTSKSYADPHPLDAVMLGGTVGVVEASRHDGFAVGDTVLAFGGWQEYALVGGDGLRMVHRIDPGLAPMQRYLGALGMPGMTAWYGLHRIIEPKSGETVVVSAASGAVGMVVGQLAKAAGCRVVGVAGGPDKCAFVTQELGFDACLDHKALTDPRDFDAALAAAAPAGVDGCFENVGGMVFEGTLRRMNAFGRVAVCGMIAGYNGEPVPLKDPTVILRSRLKVQGFIISENPADMMEAFRELAGLHGAGRLRYRETVADGLEAAPEAFFGLLKGHNFGKQLVRLVPGA